MIRHLGDTHTHTSPIIKFAFALFIVAKSRGRSPKRESRAAGSFSGMKQLIPLSSSIFCCMTDDYLTIRRE